jgi:hypothetical protein
MDDEFRKVSFDLQKFIYLKVALDVVDCEATRVHQLQNPLWSRLCKCHATTKRRLHTVRN